MKWRPVFSQLLQSKAALLQAITPEPKHQPPPQPQSDMPTPVQANSPITVSKSNIHSFLSLLQARLQNTAAQSRVNTHITTPQSLPQAASTEAAPSSSTGEHVASVQAGQHPSKEACGDPDKVTVHNSQTERQPQAPSASTTLQVTAAPDGASPSSCNGSEARPPLSVTVPLIRSKTGRIILPSSLKPSKWPVNTFKFLSHLNMLICIMIKCLFCFFSFHNWSRVLHSHGRESKGEGRGW